MPKTVLLFALLSLMGAQVTFSQTNYPGFRGWMYCSPPPAQIQAATSELETNFNRAQLSWYVIEPSFYYGQNQVRFPEAELSAPYTRQINPTEVFPDSVSITGDNLQNTFNLHFLPGQPGPYNFETLPTSSSAGIDADGNLLAPDTRWAGIMRWFADSDLPEQGIEAIDFWLLDPFLENPAHQGVTLTFQIGDISEDALLDGHHQLEYGSLSSLDTTVWGTFSLFTPDDPEFPLEDELRSQMDVGLDGLSDEAERIWFETVYLEPIANAFGENSPAYQKAWEDPSHDNFRIFDDSSSQVISLLDRYAAINGMEGNSAYLEPASGFNNYTSHPDHEDLNLNRVLDTQEMTEDYVLELKPGMQEVASFIVDSVVSEVHLVSGGRDTVTWYHFQMPLVKAGSNLTLDDFRDVMGLRLVLSDAREPVTLRFVESRILNFTELRWNEPRFTRYAALPYPNPFTETVRFEIVNRDQRPTRLQLWDIRGRKVEDYVSDQFSAGYTPGEKLRPGNYFFELSTINAIDGRPGNFRGWLMKVR